MQYQQQQRPSSAANVPQMTSTAPITWRDNRKASKCATEV